MRKSLPIALLLLVSGCSSGVDRLAARSPQAENFPSALAAEYLAFSRSEAEQGRKDNAEYFADKGLKALDGKAVAPEAATGELVSARKSLIAQLKPDLLRVAPQKAARAQLYFDCWQKLRDATCRDAFTAALADVQEVSDSLIYGQETDYVIEFEPHASQLDDDALKALDEIVREVVCVANYRIELQDVPRNSKKKDNLNSRRVNAIRQALVKRGVPTLRIRAKEAHSGKEVVLSSDAKGFDVDEVVLTIRTFGLIGTALEGK